MHYIIKVTCNEMALLKRMKTLGISTENEAEWRPRTRLREAFLSGSSPHSVAFQMLRDMLLIKNKQIYHVKYQLQQPQQSAELLKTVHYIDGSGQEKRNSNALAMELRLSCTDPSICETMEFRDFIPGNQFTDLHGIVK